MTLSRFALLSLCLLALAIRPSPGLALAVATQPPTQLPPQADGQRPGVYRLGPGITTPRLLKEVRPQYTSAAERARIEGIVIVECVVHTDGTIGETRVVLSLDPIFGLDKAAVAAAKQWSFEPGKKDNVPVPVLITIELMFALRGPGPESRWPGSFPTGAMGADARGKTDTVEGSGLRIQYVRPEGWSARESRSTDCLLVLAEDDGRAARMVSVLSAPAGDLLLPKKVPTAQLLQLVLATEKQLPDPAAAREFIDAGYVEDSGRTFAWYEVRHSRPEVGGLPPELTALARTQGGMRRWVFTTIVGTRQVCVVCTTVFGASSTSSDRDKEMRAAGAQFRTIIQRMTLLPTDGGNPR